jgi:hypothetical protein
MEPQTRPIRKIFLELAIDFVTKLTRLPASRQIVVKSGIFSVSRLLFGGAPAGSTGP